MTDPSRMTRVRRDAITSQNAQHGVFLIVVLYGPANNNQRAHRRGLEMVDEVHHQNLGEHLSDFGAGHPEDAVVVANLVARFHVLPLLLSADRPGRLRTAPLHDHGDGATIVPPPAGTIGAPGVSAKLLLPTVTPPCLISICK
jgi:hypothetical protein